MNFGTGALVSVSMDERTLRRLISLYETRLQFAQDRFKSICSSLSQEFGRENGPGFSNSTSLTEWIAAREQVTCYTEFLAQLRASLPLDPSEGVSARTTGSGRPFE